MNGRPTGPNLVMEYQVKGNIIVATRRFFDSELDVDQAKAVLDLVDPELAEMTRTASRGNWYPREALCSLWRALHQSANSDEEALALLDRCGRFIGDDATNTFLRLLVRLLTPSVFAKKFPRIWSRDFNFGRIETKLGDNMLEILAFELEGHDYFGFTAAGWFAHSMTTMGCKNVTVTHDATLANPGPDELSIVMRWD